MFNLASDVCEHIVAAQEEITKLLGSQGLLPIGWEAVQFRCVTTCDAVIALRAAFGYPAPGRDAKGAIGHTFSAATALEKA